jgi:hypothetical protein
MDMHVDQTGGYQKPIRIESLASLARLQTLSQLADYAINNHNIKNFVNSLCGVNYATTFNQQVHG